ncbi:MAG: YcxB family protein [Armatimonadetes bacterium]|nr:YcxB family protein [Armatimonadota bacterium]
MSGQGQSRWSSGMFLPVAVEVHYAEDELVAAGVLDYRHSWRRWAVIGIGVASAYRAASQLLCWPALSALARLVNGAELLLCGGLLLGFDLVIAWLARYVLRADEAWRQPAFWVISDDGIMVQQPEPGRTPWSQVKDVVEGGGVFLIRTPDALVLPTRCLSAEQAERVRSLAQAHTRYRCAARRPPARPGEGGAAA